MGFIQVLLLLGFLVTASADDGIGIDPHGGIRAAGDEGSGLDPHGGRITANGDEGNGFDPHG